MKKLLTLFFVFFGLVTFGQVYQLMPQYGYQANRMRFDSTLQIPTVCGVPTLKSNVTRLGAIAFDSCNNRFYTFNPKTSTWSQVSGGGGSTDTTSLSQRIDARVKYTDTASMLAPYFRRSLSANDTIKTNARVLQINSSKSNGSKISTLKIDTSSLTYQLQDDDGQSYFSLSSSNNSIAQNFQGIGNSIIMQNSIDMRSEGIAVQDGFQVRQGTGSFWYINEWDTIGILPRTYGLPGQILKLQNEKQLTWQNESDTSTVVIMSVVNATGTTLTKGEVVYLFGATGSTASVKRANNKNDSTSSKTIGIVRRDIAPGATGTVTTQGQVEKLNLAAYNEGDILWLDSIDGGLTKNKPQAPYHAVFVGVVERANNGNGLMYIKPQNGVELDEVHDVLIQTPLNNQIIVYSDTLGVWKNRSVYTIVDTTKLSARIDQRVRYTDTASMLTPYLRKLDTASLSTRINQRLLISDTAGMLAPYMRDADTVSLSNRINQRLLITDTSVFDRKQIPANSFMANNTAAVANSAATYFKDTSGTYTGTVTWTGTTAPSGTTNFNYRFSRVGKCVQLTITLNYATTGNSLTAMVVPFQSDFPTPSQPAGLTNASELLWAANAQFSNSTPTTIANAGSRTFLRRNSANTGFEIVSNFSAIAVRTALIHVTYFVD